jgi:hypothetical protein
MYRFSDLTPEAQQSAIEEYKDTRYFYYYEKGIGHKAGTTIEEAIEEDCICFEIDGELIGEYRICTECGKMMVDGYVINDGEEYYCSEDCLHKHCTPEQYGELFEEDCAYYTDWLC